MRLLSKRGYKMLGGKRNRFSVALAVLVVFVCIGTVNANETFKFAIDRIWTNNNSLVWVSPPQTCLVSCASVSNSTYVVRRSGRLFIWMSGRASATNLTAQFVRVGVFTNGVAAVLGGSWSSSSMMPYGFTGLLEVDEGDVIQFGVYNPYSWATVWLGWGSTVELCQWGGEFMETYIVADLWPWAASGLAVGLLFSGISLLLKGLRRSVGES